MAYNKYTINNLVQWLINTTLTAWSTTLILQAWYGTLFPSTFPFIIKCEWFLNWNVIRREIMKCTNRSADTLTVVRSFEACPANYTALTQTSTAVQFEVWDTVSLIISKETINDIQNEVTRLESDKLNIATEITNNQNQTQIFNTSTWSANAYLLTLTPALTSYTTWQRVVFKSNFTNTWTSTINVNWLWVKTIKKLWWTTDLISWDIQNWQIVELTYDWTYMQLSSTWQVPAIITTKVKFWWTGSDWDLSISSWTTALSLSSNFLIKNYDTITISWTAILDITWATWTWWIAYIRCKWDFNMTWGTIQMNWQWWSWWSSVSATNNWITWSQGINMLEVSTTNPWVWGALWSTWWIGVAVTNSATTLILYKTYRLQCWAWGGSGSAVTSWTSWSWGRGWWILIIEVWWTINMTAWTIQSNGNNWWSVTWQCGWWGWGGGGSILVIYNTLTSLAWTIQSNGGNWSTNSWSSNPIWLWWWWWGWYSSWWNWNTNGTAGGTWAAWTSNAYWTWWSAWGGNSWWWGWGAGYYITLANTEFA